MIIDQIKICIYPLLDENTFISNPNIFPVSHTNTSKEVIDDLFMRKNRGTMTNAIMVINVVSTV